MTYEASFFWRKNKAYAFDASFFWRKNFEEDHPHV